MGTALAVGRRCRVRGSSCRAATAASSVAVTVTRGIAPVAAAGRAAIFIPFGHATDSHQLRNAQEMARQGAGRVITEAELTGECLSKEIFALLDEPQQIERMSTSARSLSWPNATRDIVNLIEQAAGITPSSEKVRAAAGSSSVSTRAVSTPDREKVAP